MKIFCKPQTYEVRARFDVLTSFRQGNLSVDEWYSAVQAQVSLAKYPPESASILHRDILWVFLKMRVCLQYHQQFKYRFRQVSNKPGEVSCQEDESSKSTPRHMKQVASDL